MIKGKHIAIIPARSGSKGVMNKNIRLFDGKPLLAYSVEAAIESGCFDEVMVSTDSVKYAEVAKCYGATIPFLRSDENSGDSVDKWDVVREVLTEYSSKSLYFESVCVLQPTSPLRTSADIRAAYKLYENKEAEFVISVCECEHPPIWTGTVGGNLNMTDFNRPEMFIPRQKLPKYYRLNGAIFIAETRVISSGNMNLYGEYTYAYIMDIERSVDIDSELDFEYGEYLMRRNNNE